MTWIVNLPKEEEPLRRPPTKGGIRNYPCSLSSIDLSPWKVWKFLFLEQKSTPGGVVCAGMIYWLQIKAHTNPMTSVCVCVCFGHRSSHRSEWPAARVHNGLTLNSTTIHHSPAVWLMKKKKCTSLAHSESEIGYSIPSLPSMYEYYPKVCRSGGGRRNPCWHLCQHTLGPIKFESIIRLETRWWWWWLWQSVEIHKVFQQLNSMS